MSDEDKYYEIALLEMKANRLVHSIHARALVESNGDKSKIAPCYIRLRVENLQRAAANKITPQAQQAETENALRKPQYNQEQRREQDENKERMSVAISSEEIPPGIKGWSWGAFLMHFIWAIGNRTWIGLLTLIPFVGFIMALVLGFKGREWAWKNKHWESVEHFNRVQRTWSAWGIGLNILIIIPGIIAAIAIPAYHNHYKAETSAKNESQRNADTGAIDWDKGEITLPLSNASEFRKTESPKNADEQFRLGLMYFNGEGVKKNDVEATRYFRMAAEKGHAGAQYNLGMMFDNGYGVAQNDAEAVHWYQKAAEQGYVQAQSDLGTMYHEGRGVAQNYVESAKWLREAAEQGLAQAQGNLGVMYASGQGVAQNYAEAIKWYRKAAEQGEAYAQYNLGAMYATGRGVVKNNAEAVNWYRKSAEQGFVEAIKELQRLGVR